MVEIPTVCETDAAGLGTLGDVITPWPIPLMQEKSKPNASAFFKLAILYMRLKFW
jgi:hypothetical protein